MDGAGLMGQSELSHKGWWTAIHRLILTHARMRAILVDMCKTTSYA
jgi:hypothetical protein